MSTPRIAPVTDPSPEVIELYEKGGLRAPGGQPLNIFATLAHHPALLRRWLVFATHVLTKSTLTPRDRELLILRVGVRCNSKYEFGQHHVIAQRSDITVDEIERVKVGPDDPAWSAFDAALLRAVDELHDDSRISDATWAVLSERYGDEQLLDVVFTVGQYHLVSMALNTCGVELDEGIPDTL
ncbi:MAG: carboxymuconolactone decarboxylase family protein [Acidimicrobiales bacterium]